MNGKEMQNYSRQIVGCCSVNDNAGVVVELYTQDEAQSSRY
jgi:hypothetical protein